MSSHQEIGKAQKLFMIHEFSPGSIYLPPTWSKNIQQAHDPHPRYLPQARLSGSWYT